MELATSPVGIFVALVLFAALMFGIGVKWYHEALKKPGKIENILGDIAEAELKVRAEFGDVKAHAQQVVLEAEMRAAAAVAAVKARIKALVDEASK